MARGPDKPADIYAEYSDDVKRIFGDELEGVVAFGDVATGDYHPQRSWIEFLVSVKDASFSRVKDFVPYIGTWNKRRVTTPVVVSSEYIEASVDSSPIELLNMRLFHEVVCGKDVLCDLEFDNEQLRVVCEREAKRRLERIKRSYLDRQGELKQIEALMAESIDPVVDILRTLIYLRGKDPPGPRLKVFKGAGKVLNLSEAVFVKVLRMCEDEVKETKAERAQLFDDYVGQLEKVAEIADQL